MNGHGAGYPPPPYPPREQTPAVSLPETVPWRRLCRPVFIPETPSAGSGEP